MEIHYYIFLITIIYFLLTLNTVINITSEIRINKVYNCKGINLTITDILWGIYTIGFIILIVAICNNDIVINCNSLCS